MKTNKYKVLLSNTVIFAIGNLLVKLISFFLMPLYTAALQTGEYGVAELLNTGVEIILPIATLCIIDALYRFSIDEDKDNSVLFANSLFILFIGCVVVLVITCIANYIFNYSFAWHFFALYITTSAYKLTTQFARGLGHVKRFAFYGVLNALVLVVSNILLLLIYKRGVEGYLLSYSIGYGISAVAALFLSREYKYAKSRKLNFKLMRDMLRFSLPNIPNMISWWINSVSDRYIILFFCGSSLTGLYTAASKLPAIINLVSSIFQQAWQYSTAKEINSKDNTSFFSNVFKFYIYICCVSCGVIILANRLICRLLLQFSFYEAWRYVPLLVLAATFGCISTYYGTFYQALKETKMLMISTVVGACVNIGLNFVLIPLYEAYGAAIATVISYVVVTVFRVIDLNNKVKIQINTTRIWVQVLLICSIAFVGCFADRPWTLVLGCLLILVIIFSDLGLLISCASRVKHLLKKRLI